MELEKNEQMTKQLNLRLPPSWYEELNKIAGWLTVKYNKRFTVQRVVRNAILMAEDQLKRACEIDN